MQMPSTCFSTSEREARSSDQDERIRPPSAGMLYFFPKSRRFHSMGSATPTICPFVYWVIARA